jgi:C_GCAxxG_C_C family probable redox protein
MQGKDVTERINKAKTLFSGPYNCSQSVAMAFSDVIGLEEDDILRLMSGFGYGMGGERTVCGAVTGGVFVISSLNKDPVNREESYAKVKRLIDEFKNGSDGTIDCLDLIGENPGTEEFQSECPVIIERVIRIVENIIR